METKISSLCAFQTGLHSVAQASPKPRAVLLLQPPKCWQYHRPASPCLGLWGLWVGVEEYD